MSNPTFRLNEKPDTNQYGYFCPIGTISIAEFVED